ncbi:DUF5011 domain-containing protein [Mucilaginibacter litoreus]|uniref:DUF5011 domain-containing protein n=1 Tax=Mucilaginibacter litoreus TaxID=1048221 RepID=A0ABW3APE0_9SPHI
MKRYLTYIVIIFAAVIFGSCGKDSFDYKEGYVGSSKITVYPIITVTGDDYIVVPKGTAYTDPGATAKVGNDNVDVATKSPVNVNAAGVYTITYSATNSDGYSATATRRVVVYSTDASAKNNDFSGNYARTTNGSVAEWTKIAPGVYSVFNPGGAPGTDLTVIVFNQTGNEVYIPQQNASDGSLTSSSDESSTPGPNGTLTKYSMVIVNAGYGAAVRTFNKQ